MGNVTLKRLILSTDRLGGGRKNKVGDKGAEGIARALKANTALEELALEDTSQQSMLFSIVTNW